MAGPARYHTSDGFPPNLGMPFIEVPAPPQPGPSMLPPRRFQTSDGLPPNNGLPIDERAIGNSENSRLSAILLQIQSLLRGQPCAAAPPPNPAPKDEVSFVREDVLYLFPEKHVTIHFLYAGHRPCDHQGLWTQNFPYKQVKLPLFMTVGEMVRRLGYPGRGLQEMMDLITPVSTIHRHTPAHPTPLSMSHSLFLAPTSRDTEPFVPIQVPEGTVWGPGQMLQQDGPSAEQTLKEIGWEARDEDDPAWVVHGPWRP